MDLVIKGDFFRKIKCFMFFVEQQKCSLPHIHLLLRLYDSITTDNIDKAVCAVIPDPEHDSILYNIGKPKIK